MKDFLWVSVVLLVAPWTPVTTLARTWICSTALFMDALVKASALWKHSFHCVLQRHGAFVLILTDGSLTRTNRLHCVSLEDIIRERFYGDEDVQWHHGHFSVRDTNNAVLNDCQQHSWQHGQVSLYADQCYLVPEDPMAQILYCAAAIGLLMHCGWYHLKSIHLLKHMNPNKKGYKSL